MTSTLTLVALAASLFSRVAAHGYVQWAKVGGTLYEGFDETKWIENKYQNSAVLITNYLLPLYDVMSPDIACGTGAQAPALSAPVNAGDSVEWRWVTHQDVHWTHDTGTHRSFIAACNGDCKNANPNDLNWIELGEEYTGQQNWNAANGWPAVVLNNDQTWSDKIPALPAGQYLLRNELTALHYSQRSVSDTTTDGHAWGTEFYPTCVALEIQGTDSSYSPINTYKFPGAYQVDEDGHYNPQDPLVHPETVPLPALFNPQPYSSSYNTSPTTTNQNQNGGGGGGGGGSGGGGGGSPSPSNTAPANVASSPSATIASPQSACSSGSRRSLARKARKMRRAHKAFRRSEH